MRKELFGSGPLVLAVLAFGTVAIATSRSAPARDDHEHEGENPGPGCAPDRPAIAHHAGGVIANPGRESPPVPCVTTTGWRTSEISVAVTNAGTVLFEPAIAAGGRPVWVLRSVDPGATWQVVDSRGDPPPNPAIR